MNRRTRLYVTAYCAGAFSLLSGTAIANIEDSTVPVDVIAAPEPHELDASGDLRTDSKLYKDREKAAKDTADKKRREEKAALALAKDADKIVRRDPLFKETVKGAKYRELGVQPVYDMKRGGSVIGAVLTYSFTKPADLTLPSSAPEGPVAFMRVTGLTGIDFVVDVQSGNILTYQLLSYGSIQDFGHAGEPISPEDLAVDLNSREGGLPE